MIRDGTYSEIPTERYQLDPVSYVRERLKEPVIMPHQADILMALANGIAGKPDPTGRYFGGVHPPRVAVRSGQKPGKTRLLVWAAYWFYECFPGAQVYMTAAIIAQTEDVLWKEMHKVLRECESRGVVIEGVMSRSAAGGFDSEDGTRKITGVSGRDVEALAGRSGRLLFIIDEASSLDEKRSQAFSGNMLGGGAMLWTSNPTEAMGPFFNAFYEQSRYWQAFHVNCEVVAKWVDDHGLRALLPFVCNWHSILEAREMYGSIESVFYRIRVLGEFILNEQGHPITSAMVTASHNRWHILPAVGPLCIGLDPAGPGKSGDDTAFAIRRGDKILMVIRFSGLSEDAIITHLLNYLRQYRGQDEIPDVIVDVEGPIGSHLGYRLRAIAEGAGPGHQFRFYGVRASAPARIDVALYVSTRDELFAFLAKWITAGGGLPPDNRLDAELQAPSWHPHGNLSSKMKLTPKDGPKGVKSLIGRSPDLADACALAVWPVRGWQPPAGTEVAPSPPRDVMDAAYLYDQQEANNVWWPNG